MFLIFNYLNFKSLNFQDFEVVRILLNWMKMDQGSGRGRGEKEIEREKERGLCPLHVEDQKREL